MNNKEFKNILKRIINEKFKGKVRRYAIAADVKCGTLMNYLKRGSKPNPEILTRLARAAGMSIAELYAEGSAVEEFVIKEAETTLYAGFERRHNMPYTAEERLYMEKLLDILRGSNKKNVSAIKENIDAFHETRNFNTSEAVKKTNDAG